MLPEIASQIRVSPRYEVYGNIQILKLSEPLGLARVLAGLLVQLVEVYRAEHRIAHDLDLAVGAVGHELRVGPARPFPRTVRRRYNHRSARLC